MAFAWVESKTKYIERVLLLLKKKEKKRKPYAFKTCLEVSYLIYLFSYLSKKYWIIFKNVCINVLVPEQIGTWC